VTDSGTDLGMVMAETQKGLIMMTRVASRESGLVPEVDS